MQFAVFCAFVHSVVFYLGGGGGGRGYADSHRPKKFEAQKMLFFMIFNVRKTRDSYAVRGVLG